MRKTRAKLISFIVAMAMILTLPSYLDVVRAESDTEPGTLTESVELPSAEISTTALAETPEVPSSETPEVPPTETPEVPSTETPEITEPEVKPEPKNGLTKVGSDYYYYVNDVAFSGGLKKLTVKGKSYYYYFDSDGKALRSKWKTINKKTYYFKKDGRACADGYVTISHYYCKFNKNAVLTRKIDMNKKMVALTFDDGPASGTPKILNALKKNNGAATFFVVGSRLTNKKYKSYVKQAYNQDCEIGNHSYNHKIFTKISKKEMKSELSKTQKAVKEITGEEPVLFRPPGGGTNKTVCATVNMPMVIWSLDTVDWKTRSAAKTKSAVLNKVKDGDIVLMHDLWSSTATAAETIIPTLTRRGYQLVTVSELAACRKTTLKNGTKYHHFRKTTKSK